VQFLNQLYLSAPGNRDLPTGGVRYDGLSVYNWGLRAPGDELTLKLDFDDHTDWTAGASTTISTETSNYKEGSGAVKIVKSGSALQASFSQSAMALDLDPTGTRGDYAYIWIYIPRGELYRAATDEGIYEISIQAGTSSLVRDAWNYNIDDYPLQEGWNLLQIDIGNPDNVLGVPPAPSSYTYFAVVVVTQNTADPVSGVLVDGLYQATKDGAPTVGTSGAGAITGALRYRVSFVSDDGLESNLGPASSTYTAAANSVALTNIPVSSDPQVLYKRLYRDLDGDGIYRYVIELQNWDTTHTDNLAEASLGGAVAPIEGDDELDNSPPPKFYAMAVHNNRVFGINAEDQTVLHPSDIGIPGAFPIVQQLTFDEQLVNLESHLSGLVIYGRDKTYLLTGEGTTDDPFVVYVASAQLGSNNYRSVARANRSHITIRESELYLVEDVGDPWYIGGPIHDTIEALDRDTSIVLHDRHRFRILLFEAGASTIYSYQYGTRGVQQITGDGSGTDPLDLRIGAWSTISLPTNYSGVYCAAIVEREAEVPEVWIGCGNNRIYKLQDETTNTWKLSSGTENVEAILETHAVPIGSEEWAHPAAPPASVGRGSPRFLMIRSDSTASATWSVTVTLLNDADEETVDSVTFDVVLPSGSGTVVVPVPYIGSHAGWCRVRMTHSGSARCKIRELRLYYTPRTKFAGRNSN
jgi:hypothetical protein